MKRPAHWILIALLSASALGACSRSSAPTDTASGGNNGGDNGGPVAGDCADYRVNRKNAYFGDLHSHTSFSLDAYFFNAINDPRAAHEFAQGNPAGLPALGSDDPYTKAREITIGRPLDFNAVTDHAEFLGGFNTLCGNTSVTQQACDQAIGKGIRGDIVNIATGNTSFQQQMLQSLVAQSPTSATAWAITKQINEDEYKPCTYTTMHAYEYSSNEQGQMFHRNVIFRGDSLHTPLNVFSAVRADTAINPQNGNDDWDLFDNLNLTCQSILGCNVLTIPHNANLSDGRMWLPMDPATGVPLGRKIDSTDIYMPMTESDAQLRRKMDVATEITQHKGNSECAAGLEGPYLQGEETSCDFEMNKSVCQGLADDPPACKQYCKGDPATDPNFCTHRTKGVNLVDICGSTGPDGKSRPLHNPNATGTENCTAPLDFYRNAMAEGMAIRQALGINPYKVNIVASSDTHNGDPGDVGERHFVGHGGVLDDDPREQLGFWNCPSGGDPSDPASCPGRVFQDFARNLNPGGLAGVWAPRNKREDIWDGIHRGETWGTSGPRIKMRTVGGWNLPSNICSQLAGGNNPVDTGAVQGALMGGNLPLPASGSPQIAVWAQQDPENYPLQAVDIVKGYVDASGKPRVKVFQNVVRTKGTVTRPSMQTCAVNVANHPEQLCTVWKDPEFNANQDAYYYARVRELPSCRWSAWICNVDKKVDCSKLDKANGMFPASSGFSGYEGCCAISGAPGSFTGKNTFYTIEERAWASPIWYEHASK